MPVVRELVNRISFKISAADKKNAEDAFTKMEKGSQRVITNTGKIGKKFALTIAGLAAAGTKIFTDFERDTGASAFFSRSANEARALTEALDLVASRSETTSRREARRAAKTLSQTRLTKDQLEEFIPILEKISIARPDLDFTGVAEAFRQVISGGNLDQLTQIIPGFKDTAELLSKTTFQSPFGDLTDVQRGEIVLDAMLKHRKELDKLVQKQRETLNFQFSALAKESSDFGLKVGETISGPVKETILLIRGLFAEMNESKELWKSIESTMRSVTSGIKTLRETTLNPPAETIGLFGTKEQQESFLEERGDPTIFKAISRILRDFNKSGIETSRRRVEEGRAKLVIDGKVVLENSNGEKVGELSESFIDKLSNVFIKSTDLKGSLNNISASNGAVVGVD